MPAYLGTIYLSQSLSYTAQSAPSLGATAQIPIQFLNVAATQLTAGASGALKYNVAWAISATTSGTTPIVYDFAGGSLLQPDGNTTTTFADFILFCIQCPSTNTDYISVGAGSNPVVWFTNAVKVYPGMTIILALPVATGLVITATSADKVTVTSHGGNQTFTILAAGH